MRKLPNAIRIRYDEVFLEMTHRQLRYIMRSLFSLRTNENWIKILWTYHTIINRIQAMNDELPRSQTFTISSQSTSSQTLSEDLL
jgi:hypothetical protein